MWIGTIAGHCRIGVLWGYIVSYKRLVFNVVFVFITCASTLAIGETFVRIFSPVASMYPRYKYSPEYGLQVYENTRMVHTIPGKYRFVYTTNEYAYRGKAVPPSAYRDKKVVLIAGDSYSFGIGVNDGEEYSARLAEELGQDYIVINLANPAWGLTQEIRRYYDFGMLYHPTVMVLQFCGNDLNDNFNNMVTTVEDGAFVFHNSNSNINWTKKLLSQSILQRSQLYNFFREKLYLLYEDWHVKRTKADYSLAGKVQTPVSPEEKFYADLLTVFANDLKKSGVELVMISVNHELDAFPYINDRVRELDGDGKLHYVDILPWFEHISNYRSEEGHLWGRVAHDIIGRNLAIYLKKISGATDGA